MCSLLVFVASLSAAAPVANPDYGTSRARHYGEVTERCPICQAGRPPNVVIELPSVWVTAPRAAALPGYVCVVAKRHVEEPFQLPASEAIRFWEEAMAVAASLYAKARPKKMNYEIHGNTIPHLHLHLFPRYEGDPFTGRHRPIDGAHRSFNRDEGELSEISRAIGEGTTHLRRRHDDKKPLLPPSPPLAAGGIRLRQWRPDDAEAVVVACQDPEIRRFTGVPEEYTLAAARQWFAAIEEGWREGVRAGFAVTTIDDDQVLGSVGLAIGSHAVGNIGYWVAAEARGQEVATTALSLISRWGLGDLGLARVQLETFPENLASQRVAEKAGFVREGVLRSALAHRGERVDAVVFSLIASDLAAGRPG